MHLIAPPSRSNWVRLRTLIVLRWIAIAGQLIAITVATRSFGLQIELGLAFLAIGAAIVANLVAVFVYPENKRLSEGEAASMLFFDITQLCFLLFLTGGLQNPFALLILAPVTISATTLSARTTIILGLTAITLISIVALWNLPLRSEAGDVLVLPELFAFGFWVAILIGVVFLAGYAQRVSAEVHAMSEALAATQMALAREQKLTDLGGVVAAAAHELGTPLATIMLVSAELMDELADQPELRSDAELIRDQAARCRDILASMGQAGKEDQHLKQAPISAVVTEAAEPHADRGKTIQYDVAPNPGASPDQPVVARRPEVIHGLRNLVQNAVDFAQSTVWIEIGWSPTAVIVRITDDGPGFPAHVLGRIGDPFVTARRDAGEIAARPGYAGMGLGLFIAKTLLERSGADLTFANAREPFEALARPGQPAGAVVECIWPNPEAEATARPDRRPLGQNAAIEV
ncbi:MAG: ActS/PrrB/RegB family redox-sensitive histidine kinase [Paracoccaceae bacterium]|nr:ActS/PrrB/RegB family redox-sensitive histidine kinase [Paracoccaceae bacterium]